MEFRDGVVGDVVVLALSGKIMTFAECGPVREKIKAYVDSGKKNFVFDLAGVPWINSEGFALLASTHVTLAHIGGRFVLANISEKIDHVLTITKCHKIIPHFDSLEDAVAYLTRPAQTV